MRYHFIKLLLIVFIISFLSACDFREKENNKLNVLSSFTIITDITKEIAKDKINIHNLVPTGTDPHEYEPLPDDLKAASNADIVLYNGFNLEGGSDGWLFKLMKSVNKTEDIIYDLSLNIAPLYLHDEQTEETQINPHYFINPKCGIVMAENILNALILNDPINKLFYEENARIYINKIKVIENNYSQGFNNISSDKRILVTSERAFQYLAKEYEITEAYIWAIDTDEIGTKDQIASLVEFLLANPVPFLFIESNVDRKPMLTVSTETKIPIYQLPLYSDEIGKKGEDADTYIKYLEYNLEVMLEGMAQNDNN